MLSSNQHSEKAKGDACLYMCFPIPPRGPVVCASLTIDMIVHEKHEIHGGFAWGFVMVIKCCGSFAVV